ncbi:MAG: hypothetical protein GQE15_32605 [Archangiaceae bacterium]|nr:hypothetical protein [Archangiaceae bacterium]
MTPTLTTLDDPDAVAVFADALESAGDPRGTLMHLQLALENRPGDARLIEAERRHLALHGKQLLGALQMASSLATLQWRRGFLQSVELRSQAADVYQRHGRVAPAPRSRLPKLVRELESLPVASRLKTLTVLMPASSFSTSHLTAVLDEVLAVRLPSVVLVRIGTLVFEDAWDEQVPGGTPLVAFHRGFRLETDTALRPALERRGLIDRLPQGANV